MYYTWTMAVNKGSSEVTETQIETLFGYASDITYAILATAAGIIAALRVKLRKNKAKNKNVDKVLLIQSLASSVFLIFSTAFSWLASVNAYNPSVTYMPEIVRRMALQGFFLSLTKLFYSFHHYIGLVLLLIMS
uniref:Uncharacterized protein n=1 Tax=Panagrolaimus sp. ES5 TaxID=591445 RepID=A0AC34G8J1_9BILA